MKEHIDTRPPSDTESDNSRVSESEEIDSESDIDTSESDVVPVISDEEVENVEVDGPDYFDQAPASLQAHPESHTHDPKVKAIAVHICMFISFF